VAGVTHLMNSTARGVPGANPMLEHTSIADENVSRTIGFFVNTFAILASYWFSYFLPK
jgi:hypothetical protein